MSDMHFLILGMQTGNTACGLPIYAFYPQSETAYVGWRAAPGADGAPIQCTVTAYRVTCKACRQLLDTKADIKKTSETNTNGGEESRRQ
jgi:hypothetical protein